MSANIATAKLLMIERNWRKLQKLMHKLEKDLNDDSKCTEHYNLLHFACRFQPPLYIVQRLTKTFPGAEKELDCMGRLPLHTALFHGIAKDVVEYLLQCYPEAASHQDCEGKTALHHAFCNYKWRSQPGLEFGKELRKSIVGIIEKICEVYPSVLTKEDMNGMSALEYAIEEEVELKVVSKLQKATEKHCSGSPCNTSKKPMSIVSITIERKKGWEFSRVLGAVSKRKRRTSTNRAA